MQVHLQQDVPYLYPSLWFLIPNLNMNDDHLNHPPFNAPLGMQKVEKKKKQNTRDRHGDKKNKKRK